MKNKTGKHYLFGFVFVALGVLLGSQIIHAQTCDVTWRKIDNPHTISGTVTIPAGQTVCVEAGVQVQFTSDGQLNLNGQIVGAGIVADRITFNGQNVFPNRITNAGTLDLTFADFGVPISMNRGTLACRDCRFNLRGTITGGSRSFLSLENVEFDSNDSIQSLNASIYGSGFNAILKNVTFRNRAFCIIADSYLYIDNLRSENSAYNGLEFSGNRLQPTYLNNVNVSNATGAGLKLSEGNYELGSSVVIQNAEYPVQGNGGLLPGSVVPASGNRNNYINATAGVGNTIYAPVAVPYVMDGFAGGVQFLPGVHIKLRENAAFNTLSGTLRALGLPDAPIFIEPFNPAQKWFSGQFNSQGDRLEYVTLDGSQLGIVDATSNGATFYIDNSIIRNHNRAIDGQSYVSAFLQGNLFTNNVTAIEADSSTRASGKTNPNLFENNQTAMTVVFGSNADARYNWWNSPNGPTAPNNPGGTGEIINGFAQIFPFRTTRPDTTDHPPIVRIPQQLFRAATGYYQNIFDAESKVLLNWNSSDDRTIVKQKILFSTTGNERDQFTLIADNLPASQKSFELTVPNAGFQVSGLNVFVRVVAVDDKGQEGWDEWQVRVPSGEETGNLNITSNVAGQTFRGGEEVPLTWTVTASFLNSSFNCFLILDADQKIIPLGGGNSTGSFGTPVMPRVSTDSARFAVVGYGSSNRQKWFYSQPFAIRPDARFIDAAPQIALTAPAAGQQIQANSVVPISWTASDDDALRRFDIQASFDAGRTWQPVTENLPAAARSYDWQLPPNGGAVADARVRVVAFDRRFQNASDGQTRAFQIVAPTNAAPTVQLTAPANNASVQVAKSVFLTANASDSDGTIQRVEFYRTSNVIGIPGVISTTLIGSDTTAPYQIPWDTHFTGSFTISARAYDNQNVAANSAPVNFSVVIGGGQVPLSISPPELDLPNDGENFPVNSNITLRAAPGTGSRPIVRIDFYNGTQLLGSDTTAPYEIVWNEVPQGRYAIFARTVANNGAEATSKQADISVGASNDRRTTFDFDGDGKADISVFRPASGVWYLSQSTGGFTGVQFGLSTDKLVPADYDGDGKTDIAVFRKNADSTWYILQSATNTFRAARWGASNLEQQLLIPVEIPMPGDYDGDGKADLAVWRLTDHLSEPARFVILQSSNGAARIEQWGGFGDSPVRAADYDGDGRVDLTIRRGEIWYILLSQTNEVRAIQFGAAADKAVPADYDGDGKADVAVFRDGTWYLQRSSLGFTGLQFGLATDKPVPADYDGDGKTDVAVYRDGIWYLLRSQLGFTGIAFGAVDDLPVSGVAL